MRVDGVGNVMTCRTPARDDMVLETQNVVGSAENDLLAVTDWFFPSGLDHHGMFTFSRPVNALMQSVARRIAGVGTLPEKVVDVTAARHVETDVLVVGAGPAGLIAAAACARRGLTVEVFEDGPAPGGWLRWLPGTVADERGNPSPARAIAERFTAQAERTGAALRTEQSIFGIFDEADGRRVILAHGREGVVRIDAKRLVVATGAAEVAPAIAGADAPGVFNLRGACELLAHGVLPGESVALVGEDPRLETVRIALQAAEASVLGPFPEDAVTRIESRGSVRRIHLQSEGTVTTHPCDAVIVGNLPSSVYEIAAQGGAHVRWEKSAFVVAAEDDGATAHDHVRVVGGASGRTSLRALAEQARRAADAIAEELA